MEKDAFGFQHDIPDTGTMDEWRAIVGKQAKTLEGMLSRVCVSIDRMQRGERYLHLWFDVLMREVEGFLDEQARYNVQVEHDIDRLKSQLSNRDNLTPEASQRLRNMEETNAVLHANLTTARRWLAALLEETQETNNDD